MMHAAALLASVGGLFVLAAWTISATAFVPWRLAWRRPAWRPALESAAPLLLLAPLAAALGLAAATLVAGAHGCHCELASATTLHLCTAHPERAMPLVVPALALALLPATRLVAHAAGVLRRVRASRLAASRGPVAVVDARMGNAVVLALPRPVIVIDAAWWRGLEVRERRIVVAHERAHVRRRDPLLLELLSAAGAMLPRRIADPLLRAWRHRAEREADAAAARMVRDPLAVAELLVSLHRRSIAPPQLAASIFDGDALEDRVHALLEGRHAVPAPVGLGARSLLLLAVVACAPALVAAEIHVVTEALLGLLS